MSGWLDAKQAMIVAEVVDTVAPVRLEQANDAPRPDDWIYRYEVVAVVEEALRRLTNPAAPTPADLARWLQEAIESQPAITIRRGVEPQVAWRALADELLRRWGS